MCAERKAPPCPYEQKLLRRAKRKGSKWQFRISNIIPGTPPVPHAHYPAALPCGPVAMRLARAPWCGPVAVGRDVPIAPPRHRRGARLGIPRPVAWAPGVTGRRALRSYRGRTETPQQNSQRVLLAITHGA